MCETQLAQFRCENDKFSLFLFHPLLIEDLKILGHRPPPLQLPGAAAVAAWLPTVNTSPASLGNQALHSVFWTGHVTHFSSVSIGSKTLG